jgi:prepilin-type N-terminal cleavage/methylation domain-containing protein
MKRNSNKGFTLIELLVVIAIIGILSSVVLAALTTARTKGTDASIQTELSNMRSQAELYYSSNGNNYGPVVTRKTCSTTASDTIFKSTTLVGSLKTLMDGVLKKSTVASDNWCSVGASSGETNGSSWAVAIRSVSDSTKSFCVDSFGTSKVVTGDASSTTAVMTQTSTSSRCI